MYLFIFWAASVYYHIANRCPTVKFSYVHNKNGILVLTDNQKDLCEVLHDIFITTRGIARKLSIKAHFGFKTIYT